ncbi:hypothetical protein G4H71_08405 [Rhodococcus triatomae]|uniref:Uncharacterized protein n=1 Tax=Rhodococcus triatomae TaxID=300028 RepID=A0A1G8IEC1_9NOCA|nr:hypothetical protein [Rhodococcus triatomae]QNG21032.1 hypothetical protein G4H72_21980 [Rhodococcus triatomae]QNG23053.1 hypothetical protein G4H71_08405 [Rhodococcus triatomae]SDI17254.1 hypothetical protein SAMN05444695_105252 [Rhodococcus triatomae]
MACSESTWPPYVRYSFTISGELSERVLAAFPELSTVEAPRAFTTLQGPVSSPTALRGLLARFDSLGLTVIEMSRLPH